MSDEVRALVEVLAPLTSRGGSIIRLDQLPDGFCLVEDAASSRGEVDALAVYLACERQGGTSAGAQPVIPPLAGTAAHQFLVSEGFARLCDQIDARDRHEHRLARREQHRRHLCESRRHRRRLRRQVRRLEHRFVVSKANPKNPELAKSQARFQQRWDDLATRLLDIKAQWADALLTRLQAIELAHAA